MRSDTSTKVLILDRDGTLNAFRQDYVMSADDWEPLPNALEAVAKLNQAGWHTVIATNQAGLGRGLFDITAFNSIHQKLNELLSKLGGRIDAVFFCPHTDSDQCLCRKPLPGLYQEIGRRYNLNLAEVPAVGESMRDIQAIHAAGCAPHLVLTGECQRLGLAHALDIVRQVPSTTIHQDLMAFAHYLIRKDQGLPDALSPVPGLGGLS